MPFRRKNFQDKALGRFFLDLSKLTYAGLVLVAFAAWALERKIGIVDFAIIAVAATFIGSLFVWLGAKLLKKGHIEEEM